MQRFIRFVHFLFLLTWIAACSAPPTPAPTATPLLVTSAPVLSQVSFTTSDGANIGAIMYGSGDTVVIFSVMGDCSRGWEDMAKLVSENGMMALTYQWRACKDSGMAVESELQKFVDDLRGAIQFVRGQGAKKIILAGASLGGVASAKLAVETSPNGLIIVASPREIEDWGFKVGLGDVNIDMPKLFITAENDNVVSADRSRELFDLVAEPKEWQTYPGTAHGTDVFQTESREAMKQRILDFILTVAASP